MKIAAFDLGTKVGFAVCDGSTRYSGSQNLAPRKHENWASRFDKFQQLLDSISKNFSPDRVVYEEVRAHSGTDAAHMYGAFMATLQSWCNARGIPCVGVPVGTIKKFATGRGNASKMEVLMAVEKRWGVLAQDDNEADAIALLEYARSGE
jgi:crossover junction endodeoxyribonuclease RuvC